MLELAFVRLRVCEGDGDGDKTIGKFCLSAASLQPGALEQSVTDLRCAVSQTPRSLPLAPTALTRPGYRHLPLHDSLGQMFLFSSLFVRSQLRLVSPPTVSLPRLKSPAALPAPAGA